MQPVRSLTATSPVLNDNLSTALVFNCVRRCSFVARVPATGTFVVGTLCWLRSNAAHTIHFPVMEPNK